MVTPVAELDSFVLVLSIVLEVKLLPGNQVLVEVEDERLLVSEVELLLVVVAKPSKVESVGLVENVRPVVAPVDVERPESDVDVLGLVEGLKVDWVPVLEVAPVSESPLMVTVEVDAEDTEALDVVPLIVEDNVASGKPDAVLVEPEGADTVPDADIEAEIVVEDVDVAVEEEAELLEEDVPDEVEIVPDVTTAEPDVMAPGLTVEILRTEVVEIVLDVETEIVSTIEDADVVIEEDREAVEEVVADDVAAEFDVEETELEVVAIELLVESLRPDVEAELDVVAESDVTAELDVVEELEVVRVKSAVLLDEVEVEVVLVISAEVVDED